MTCNGRCLILLVNAVCQDLNSIDMGQNYSHTPINLALFSTLDDISVSRNVSANELGTSAC